MESDLRQPQVAHSPVALVAKRLLRARCRRRALGLSTGRFVDAAWRGLFQVSDN